MVNELQRIMSAFIQILFIILLPYIWWFLTARGKVPFMEWIGLKAIKRVEDSYLIAWIIGGFLLFTIFSMFIFPLTRSIETATSAFSDMGLKALPSILIYSFLQTSLPEELLFRGFLLKRLVSHMPFFFANTIQAIAFGLIHGILFVSLVSIEITLFITLFTGVIAAYLGFVNEKKAGGSIFTSWIIHALANIFSVLIWGIYKYKVSRNTGLFYFKNFSFFINISYLNIIMDLQIWRCYMNPTQRAWAYVSRKRLRSLILFLILFVLLAGISACLTLMKSNKTVENNLYRSLNTSFSIKRIEADQTFQLSQLDDLKMIKGLERISPELETIAKLTDKEVVTGEQSIQRDDLTEAEKNLISLIALEDSSKDVAFTSSAFSLIEGRHIQKGDRKKVLIHEDLAKKNNLKVGEKISLNPAQVEGNSGQTLDYEIVGVFSGQKQEKFTGLSSDFSENTVYTDYESSQNLLGNKEAQVTAARFYLENPKDMDGIIQEVEKLSLENQGFQVEKENKAFEQIKDSVSTFQTFLQIFLYGIMIAGVGALILVLSLWLRERVYEVGILLALGKGKIAIFSQFCLEVILVSLVAILPAFVAGNAITSYLLKTVLASGDQAALQDTLAKATNLSTSLLSFGESYVFLLVISSLSVALCFIFLFRKSPKEILSSIS